MRKIVLFVLISISGFSSDKANPEDKDPVIEMLTNFYTLYIDANYNAIGISKEVEVIKRKYLTTRFIKKIAKEELDYDPIVNAQDYDKNWIKTLSLKKESKKDSYKVCFNDSYQNALRCLIVSVKNENGAWKIDDILPR